MDALDTHLGSLVIGVTLFALALAVATLWTRPHHGDQLEVTQMYLYPVKGIRGCAITRGHIGRYGLIGDRTYCLQRVHRDKDGTLTKHETMLVGLYLQLALLQASVTYNGSPENAADADIAVSWLGGGTEFDHQPHQKDANKIKFPLQPSTKGRHQIEVSLHNSTAPAYDMGDELGQWFSDRLGFEVRLVHIGDGSRPVLGSMAPNSEGGLRRARLAARIRGFVPFLAYPAERLAFSDIAHYLVVTEESNDQVTSRLEGDCAMDVTKFRPNIVVRGASGPYVEDYWGELTFDGGIRMPLTSNCYRCQSITVDYNTGRTAQDDRGMVWKKLNKDRRVDKGAKYSPVFGRYGYCFGPATGKTIHVGQKAQVTYVNSERTTFDWPLLTSFGLQNKK